MSAWPFPCQKNALRPMASIDLEDGKAVGSSQHSSLAQGFVLTTSGGSTPRLRQMNRPALKVFIRDFNLQPTVISLAIHESRRQQDFVREATS